MKTYRYRCIVMLIFWAMAGVLPYPVFAQAAPVIDPGTARLSFPDSVTFQLAARNTSGVVKVSLAYGTNGRTCVNAEARQTVEFTPGAQMKASWTWNFHHTGSLPPGAQIWYRWELTDAAGHTTAGERQTLTVKDDSRAWRTLDDDHLHVLWYEGGQSFGRMALEQARESLERLEKRAGVAPSGDVTLNLYDSAQAVRRAASSLPEWAAGVAYPDYGSILLGISPDEDAWARRSIAHELAHLVTGEQIFNCIDNRLPTWLEEGLAVYAEGDIPEERVTRVERALQENRLPTLRSLAGGFAANSELAELGYAQSGVFVQYLLETHGAEKMQSLLQAVQQGVTIDRALERVYAGNTDALDSAWRVSLGYQPLPAVESQPGARATSTGVPTLALWTPVFGQPSATPTPVPPSPTPTPQESPSDTPAPQASPTPVTQAGGRAGLPLWIPVGGGAAIILALLAWLFIRRRS